MELPECYANFGEGDCDNCPYASYCEDAGDLPLLGESGRHWSYNEALDGWYWMKHTEVGGGRLSKLLGELIFELDVSQASSLWEFLSVMSALSKQKPATYRVVRARILQPQATYQELADDLGLKRQGVEMHLKTCAEMVEELRPALANPHKPLRRNKDERFKLRCSGNRMHVLLDDKDILSLPMSEENSKNALPMVDALNNLHWRRREALIEEIEK